MAQNSNATDGRSDQMKIEMAQHFDDFEADYRDGDLCTVVRDHEQFVVIADHKGYEFNEWDEQFGDEFSQIMHDLAREATDRNWGSDYPLVFDKLED